MFCLSSNIGNFLDILTKPRVLSSNISEVDHGINNYDYFGSLALILFQELLALFLI